MTRHELAQIAAMALQSGAMVKKCRPGEGLNLTSRQWTRMAQDSTVKIIDKHVCGTLNRHARFDLNPAWPVYGL